MIFHDKFNTVCVFLMSTAKIVQLTVPTTSFDSLIKLQGVKNVNMQFQPTRLNTKRDISFSVHFFMSTA